MGLKHQPTGPSNSTSTQLFKTKPASQKLFPVKSTRGNQTPPNQTNKTPNSTTARAFLMESPITNPAPPDSDLPPSHDIPLDTKHLDEVGIGREKTTEEKREEVESVAAATARTQKSVRWSEQLVSENTFVAEEEIDGSDGGGSNPYVSHTSAALPPSTSFKERMDGVKNVLGRWGRSVREAAKKAEDLAGNTWQHLKTSPSLADAAMGRIAHSTKVLAEGGYEKIFHQTFDTVPEEFLKNSFACYLSTSAGPVMGTLYVSTAKLAFCSDNPLPYKNGDQTEWSYYKVVIPLLQLKAVNPSSSRVNSSEKYIQIISVDNHEFWYMGFLNYDAAVQCLQEALQSENLQSV